MRSLRLHPEPAQSHDADALAKRDELQLASARHTQKSPRQVAPAGGFCFWEQDPERSYFAASSRALNPGSSLPSRNSRNEPPPVEMKLNLSPRCAA